MRRISTDELKEKLEKQEVELIEVLDEEEYENSHIEGAVNIPLGRIVSRSRNKYDEDEVLVVYCSDAECTASPAAARKLEGAGFHNVLHYRGGKKEWKEAGLPMEKGSMTNAQN